MTIAIDSDRFQQITTLQRGNHKPNDGTDMCVMEAVAWVTHKDWTDNPPCVCPVIGVLMRSWNDGLLDDDDRLRLLKPLIPLVINTKGSPELEQRRATMAADWLVRVHTPAWLELAGLKEQAKALSSLPEITDFANCPPVKSALEAARKDAAAAWDAARAAAGAAAWAAAWAAARAAAGAAAWAAARAAAWDAAGAAAGDAAGAAARDAAWAAAWAAAWDAAGDAAGAAAWDALKPTQDKLQESAVDLLHRLINAQEPIQ